MYSLSLRLIRFFPFPLFIDSEIYETIHSNFRDAPQFPKRKNLGENLFSLNICEVVTSKQRRCKPQAPIKGGNFGAKLTHPWLLIRRIISSRVKNYRTRF